MPRSQGANSSERVGRDESPHASTNHYTGLVSTELLRRQRLLRWEVAVVDIPSVPDCFDDENVLLAVPGDNSPVVASAKLVVWKTAELFEAMGRPVFRLVEFLDQPLLGFGVESLQ